MKLEIYEMGDCGNAAVLTVCNYNDYTDNVLRVTGWHKASVYEAKKDLMQNLKHINTCIIENINILEKELSNG